MRDNGGHVRVWHIASFRCAALRNLVAIGHSGLWRVISRGPGAPKNVDRTGGPSITKTETLRSANPPQMPKGLMCKLGQHGREYGGPAGSRGIDPSCSRSPLRSNCWGRSLWTGGIPTTRPDIQAKPQFRLRLSGLHVFASGLFRPAPQKVRLPAEHFRLSVVLD
jgi:hypothetical protein